MSADPLIGQTLNGFEILGLLGRGGMGVVYRANQVSLDRIVALKILPAHLANDPDYLKRFNVEARAAAKLNHPNIIQIYDFGHADMIYYFAMEFVEGSSIAGLLHQYTSFPEMDAINIIRQSCSALAYAHQRGIIHRDIKPDNLMLTHAGEIKLGDLGLAKVNMGDEMSLTQTGAALGTPYYISPEQIRGEKKIDARSDIYSLGATFYHIVTGTVPFDGNTSAVVMSNHMNMPVEDPRNRNPNLSEHTARVILKMMAKEPSDRYDSVVVIEEILANFDPNVIPETAPSGSGLNILPESPQLADNPPSAPTPVPSSTTLPPAPESVASTGTSRFVVKLSQVSPESATAPTGASSGPGSGSSPRSESSLHFKPQSQTATPLHSHSQSAPFAEPPPKKSKLGLILLVLLLIVAALAAPRLLKKYREAKDTENQPPPPEPASAPLAPAPDPRTPEPAPAPAPAPPPVPAKAEGKQWPGPLAEYSSFLNAQKPLVLADAVQTTPIGPGPAGMLRLAPGVRMPPMRAFIKLVNPARIPAALKDLLMGNLNLLEAEIYFQAISGDRNPARVSLYKLNRELNNRSDWNNADPENLWMSPGASGYSDRDSNTFYSAAVAPAPTDVRVPVTNEIRAMLKGDSKQLSLVMESEGSGMVLVPTVNSRQKSDYAPQLLLRMSKPVE
ncbi:MAG: protein kinase [Verrucomicrobiae bacterium]|nr:protein kinase [Verrucomicrobiae bacterium]